MRNKRKTKRVTVHVPVDGQDQGLFSLTQTVDVSQRGIGLITKQKVPVNKEIAVQLDVTPEEDPIFVIGKVKWVHNISDTDHYRVGMTFKRILKGSKTRFQKYFKKNGRTNHQNV